MDLGRQKTVCRVSTSKHPQPHPMRRASTGRKSYVLPLSHPLSVPRGTEQSLWFSPCPPPQPSFFFPLFTIVVANPLYSDQFQPSHKITPVPALFQATSISSLTMASFSVTFYVSRTPTRRGCRGFPPTGLPSPMFWTRAVSRLAVW